MLLVPGNEEGAIGAFLVSFFKSRSIGVRLGDRPPDSLAGRVHVQHRDRRRPHGRARPGPRSRESG